MTYIIRSVSEGAAHDEPPLFWSNSDGWGDAATATRFTEEERQDFHLPLSAGHDAAWVKQGDGEEPMTNETPPTALPEVTFRHLCGHTSRASHPQLEEWLTEGMREGMRERAEREPCRLCQRDRVPMTQWPVQIPTDHNAEVAPGVRGHRYNVHAEDYDYMSSARAFAVRGPAGVISWHVYAKGTHALVGRAAWRAEAVQIILAYETQAS